MILDELQTVTVAGRVECSARMRWIGGEFVLRIQVPADFAPPQDDATAFMLLALPLALYRGEELYVDGLVSATTLRQTERIQAIYASWDPAVRRCRVRVLGEAPNRPPAQGHGCLLSRGVDSVYSATAAHTPSLTHLIFCDTLTPHQSPQVCAQELKLVQALAEQIGLPLLRISTNLRDPAAQLIDYQDMHGAGIAFMAHSLSGGLGRVVVPSGLTYAFPAPAGSHPLLDPLFASECLAFTHHGLELGRPGKAAELVARCPDVLRYLKVCFNEEQVGNCGKCRKCLWTMIALQAAGALQLASLFPDRIDPQAIARLRIPDLTLRLFWMQAAASLGDSAEERRIRDAVQHALRRSARPSPGERLRRASEWVKGESERASPYWSASPSAQFRNMTNVSLAALRAGVPHAYGIESASPQPTPAWSIGPLESACTAPAPDPSPALVGLLQLLDRRNRRHLYAAGAIPPLPGLERVGELGALLRAPGEDGIAVWLTSEGRLSTECYEPTTSALHLRTAARWALAPIRSGVPASAASRSREILRRTLHVFARLRGTAPHVGGSGPSGERISPQSTPVGYLSSEAGEGRLPLLSALHPITGDQLLSTEQRESADRGYGVPILLGYLAALAPASGTLVRARPALPWT